MAFGLEPFTPFVGVRLFSNGFDWDMASLLRSNVRETTLISKNEISASLSIHLRSAKEKCWVGNDDGVRTGLGEAEVKGKAGKSGSTVFHPSK